MRAWRLVVDGPGHGAWNMGADEALLASAAQGGPPALRLYRWQGAWLSLGYAQPWSGARNPACERAGVGLVRRVTGGRAVLHGADLTYSITAPEALLPSGLDATYERVCEALIEALAELGVDAQASVGTDADPGFDCFAVPAAREVCVGGRKLAGSAQRRARGAVLQHGSIRLGPDPPAAREASGLSALATGATSLAEQGACDDLERVIAACRQGFSRVFDARFEPSGLSSGERCVAEDRVRAHAVEPLAVPRSALTGKDSPPTGDFPENHRSPQGTQSAADR